MIFQCGLTKIKGISLLGMDSVIIFHYLLYSWNILIDFIFFSDHLQY